MPILRPESSFITYSLKIYMLSSQQGTIIDRIDYNIQNVATTVEEGLKQLQKVDPHSLISFDLNNSQHIILSV